MQHTSIIQILKLNDPIKGTSQKTGRAYDIQDAECILYAEDGTVGQVGVLTIPNDLRGKVAEGTYSGTFSMRADRQTRRIGSVLTGLTPIPSAAPSTKALKSQGT
jgi:hypothetical protein